MSQFSQPPQPVGDLVPFTFSVAKEDVDDLNTLLKRPLPKATWENSGDHNREFGVTRNWLANAVSKWQDYNWDAFQARINAVPHFTVPVHDGGETYNVHFAGLFSPNPAAVPIILLHGWPGSFFEFLPILTSVQDTYAAKPDALPYHVIAPSLPGYVFTSLSTARDINTEGAANIMHGLMLKLGLGNPGYIVVGGDIGAGLARSMALQHDECRAALLTMLPLAQPVDSDKLAPPTANEVTAMQQFQKLVANGVGYADIQATKPSTIGLALATSPQALLAWIGEKMVSWVHEPMDLEDIIANVSLWWFSGCYPSSIWLYREFFADLTGSSFDKWSIDGMKKPFGLSHFPYEHGAPPRSWAESTGKVSFFRSHDKGGHFPGLEQPDALWEDIVEFVDHVKSSQR